jgi:hypothetical protein
MIDVDAEFRYRRRLIGPLTASAGFALLVPTLRHQFLYEDLQKNQRPLFQQTPVSGTLEVTAGIALP